MDNGWITAEWGDRGMSGGARERHPSLAVLQGLQTNRFLRGTGGLRAVRCDTIRHTIG